MTMLKNINANITYILILLLFATLVYFPIFGNDFMYTWDDQWQVITETTENGFTWDNLVQIFTHSFYGQYFPINQFIYTIIYFISGGYNATAFHSFCLLLHITNTVIVYFLFQKMLLLSKYKNLKDIKVISFITALLFLVHPLNTESVAWISASKILVYSFFLLLSLYMYLIYCHKKNIRYLIYSLLLFILSFGGKEQAIILPLLLFLYDWILNRDLKSKRIWLEKIIFFILSLCFGCITLYLSQKEFSINEEHYSMVERIIFASYSYFEYLFKWIFPVKLLYLYPFPYLVGEEIPLWIQPYPLFLLAMYIFLGKIIVKYKQISFGLLFFTINLLLVLHLIQMPRFSIIADRYIYLPSLGLSFIAALILTKLLHEYSKYRVLVVSFVTIIFLYWCVYSNIRVRVWNNSVSLKKEVKELLDRRKPMKEQSIKYIE